MIRTRSKMEKRGEQNEPNVTHAKEFLFRMVKRCDIPQKSVDVSAAAFILLRRAS